jgi:protease-4
MKFLTNLFTFLVRASDVLRKVLHLIVLLIIFGLIIGLLSPKIPIVPQQAALVLAPRGEVVEQLSGDPLERAIAEVYGSGEAETLLRDLIDASKRSCSISAACSAAASRRWKSYRPRSATSRPAVRK